ncbi:MAG: LysM peptidoglycan-binding domain-containing protein, partial [Flavisolibacter sp.]
MKKFFFLAFLICCQFLLFAQDELIVQHNDKGLYLSHNVVAKENFFSIGRLYNITPKEIAAFNGIDMANGLHIGQTLMIPLNTINFNQKSNKGRAVYYVVGQKEGLYRVSVKNNNVLMADLRKWNKLSNDNISTGQKLVIGYLDSPEASQVVAYTEPAKTEIKEEIERDSPPPAKEEVLKKQPEEKKAEPTRPQPVNNQVAQPNGNGGYFKSHFDRQVKLNPVKKDETASAGIFKTASGWQDAKYYALLDGVEPGTI